MISIEAMQMAATIMGFSIFTAIMCVCLSLFFIRRRLYGIAREHAERDRKVRQAQQERCRRTSSGST